MSPIFEPSRKDIMRGKMVSEPAWYRIIIDSFDEGKPSKDGQSTNYTVEATILENADTGDKTDEGIMLMFNFNSKAMGFLTGLFQACGQDIAVGGKYDTAGLVGQVVEQFVGHKTYDNRQMNDAQHKYRPAK